MPGKRERESSQSTHLPDVLLEKYQEINSVSWHEENRTAIDALNKFVEENGAFSDFQRAF